MQLVDLEYIDCQMPEVKPKPNKKEEEDQDGTQD